MAESTSCVMTSGNKFLDFVKAKRLPSSFPPPSPPRPPRRRSICPQPAEPRARCPADPEEAHSGARAPEGPRVTRGRSVAAPGPVCGAARGRQRAARRVGRRVLTRPSHPPSCLAPVCSRPAGRRSVVGPPRAQCARRPLPVLTLAWAPPAWSWGREAPPGRHWGAGGRGHGGLPRAGGAVWGAGRSTDAFVPRKPGLPAPVPVG